MNDGKLPNLIVLRAAADLPPGLMPPRLDGLWLDLNDMPRWPGHTLPTAPTHRTCTPTGRFEVRDDGAVAEVWEVHGEVSHEQ